MKNSRQINQNSYKPFEGFIYDYQKLVKNTVIPYQYQVLRDEAEGAPKSHVFANYINAGKVIKGESSDEDFYGQVFQDSDAAKWIEAVAYSLSVIPDKELESKADELIDIIEGAQDEDGYLNTYYTIKDRDKRFTNLLEGHELYCSGHMMEAACAYYESTGKDKLLRVMQKNVEHIYKIFITDKHLGYPGHPEIELALLKMYRVTGDKKCLELAKHFIDVRGVDSDFFRNESKKRDWTVWGNKGEDDDYQQSGMPLREMKDVRGHAVRAVYLLTGMADLATETDDKELFEVCKVLWDSISKKQMYITGGIGSTVHGEAFSVDYDLPSDTAYAETCASIGLIFFASRMLEKEIDSTYADVMERAFYNTVLAGIQLDGKRFFYVNPLEIIPGVSGIAQTHRHTLPQRPGWYDCACCPPNAARLISSFGKYAYSENETTAYCHLYAAGDVNFENGIKLSCETKYPYEFTIKYHIWEGNGKLAIRIPFWSKKQYSVITDNPYYESKGYIYINVKEGDEIELILNDKPYNLYASEKVARLSGLSALCRGPLVYCFEGVDNEDDILSLSMRDCNLGEVSYSNVEALSGATAMTVKLKKREQAGNDLYSMVMPSYTDFIATAIPYYTWGNRGETQMRIFLPRG